MHMYTTGDNMVIHQRQGDFALKVKVALLLRKAAGKSPYSITGLASVLGRSRTSVSLAVNHPTLFIRLKREIRQVLDL